MPMTLSGDGTITGLAAGGLPDNSITQAEIATGVAGKGPAFSAYASASQTVTANTSTKLSANTEEFDTASCYDNSTYRFTPNVAGYYQVNGMVNPTSTTSVTRSYSFIYKNGALFKTGMDISSSTAGRTTISALIYLNGTTDYVEFYFLLNGVGTLSTSVTNAETNNYFQAYMVRAA